MSSSFGTTEVTTSFSHAEQRLCALLLYSQASHLSQQQEKEPLFTASCPPVSQGRVPCRIVAGQQTSSASRPSLLWQHGDLVWRTFLFMALLMALWWRPL